MRKLNVLILVSLFILICSCSNEKVVKTNEIYAKDKSEQKEQDTKEKKKYWVNSSSNVLHNRTCRWYNNTKNGYFADDCVGKSCGICGGCN